VSGLISQNTLLEPSVTTIGLAEITEEFQVIDVRSASEFQGGTLPGGVNIPLFDEDERSVVGTIYKHGGRENAIRQGLDFMEGKVDHFLELFQPYRERPLAIVCARGGMRSRSVVNLLRQFGFAVFQFEGGYKRYRNGVMAVLDSFAPRLIVIHGFTGTGETRILQHLENSIRSEERRVGKECRRLCRSRWSPYH
jgi:tRNA 2-selenouridine synthase